jgi:hypothetical protein
MEGRREEKVKRRKTGRRVHVVHMHCFFLFFVCFLLNYLEERLDSPRVGGSRHLCVFLVATGDRDGRTAGA